MPAYWELLPFAPFQFSQPRFWLGRPFGEGNETSGGQLDGFWPFVFCCASASVVTIGSEADAVEIYEYAS